MIPVSETPNKISSRTFSGPAEFAELLRRVERIEYVVRVSFCGARDIIGPEVNTQDEIDKQAYGVWASHQYGFCDKIPTHEVWSAALKWERERKKP